jgi:hypothetical protein
VVKLKSINERIFDLGTKSVSVEDEYRLLNLDFHDLIHAAAAAEMPRERQYANFTMSDFFIAQSTGFTSDLPARAAQTSATNLSIMLHPIQLLARSSRDIMVSLTPSRAF